MVKKSNILLIVITLLFLIPFVNSTITQSLNKQTYYSGEVATLTYSCSGTDITPVKPIQFRWFNASGYLLQTNLGTCSASNQFVTYSIPLGSNSTNANVSSNTSLGSTALSWFNISSINNNDLVINSFSFPNSIFLGKNLGIGFTVADKNNSKVTNAYCRVRITKGGTSPLIIREAYVIDGVGAVEVNLDPNSFEEGVSYIASIRCECPLANSSQNYCYDENSNPIYGSYGSAQAPFSISQWLNIQTFVDQSNYRQKEEIFICANVTNLYTENYTLLTQLNYLVRCSAGMDNYQDLDRAIIISDSPDNPDLRGIPFNSTRMQCKRFVIPEPRYLQGRTSQCFASTYVSVLYEQVNKIMKSYRTDSSIFNITLSDGLQIQPDWQRLSTYQWNSIINLSDSSYNDWNGTGIANIDLRVDKVITELLSTSQFILPRIDSNIMYNSKYIKNWTSYYCNGTLIQESGLEINDDGNLELELRNVNITNSPVNCFNITINFNDFEERQVKSLEGTNTSLYSSSGYLSGINTSLYNSTGSLYRSALALEGIENKTGTFHLSVDCPVYGYRENNMVCNINAKVEDSQLVEKEVKFTCWIADGTDKISSISFNQMINKTLLTIPKSFNIPNRLILEKEYVLQCEALYYNFASRTDSFYDTFIVKQIGAVSNGRVESTSNIPEAIINEIKNTIDSIGSAIGKISPIIKLLICFLGFVFLAFIIIFGIYKTKKHSNLQ